MVPPAKSIGTKQMPSEQQLKSAAIEPKYVLTWAHLGRAYTTNASLRFGGREDYAKAQGCL